MLYEGKLAVNPGYVQIQHLLNQLGLVRLPVPPGVDRVHDDWASLDPQHHKAIRY
jgi:hypothetical protein